VDLDGTLIRTDILWESVIQLWRKPMVAARALFALLAGGKAGFKNTVAENTEVDPALLPYRDEVLEFIRAQRASGRDVVLATATHHLVARRIADHLGLFSRVFATEGTTNLSARAKRDVLAACYGERGFDYIGDHEKDMQIFSTAREALLVNPSPSLARRAAAVGTVSQVFRDERVTPATFARAVRMHQWPKNILVAIPLLTAHLVYSPEAWVLTGVAFFAFCCVASATYLVNDLLDLQSDRMHAQKRHRPLASGHLAIPAAMAWSMGLGMFGLAIAIAFLPRAFVGYLGVYVALTLAYSFDLKRRLLIDALSLAILYTLRILAGGAALEVPVSEWLLMFSLFMFLSLAFLKRGIELQSHKGGGKVSGRGYAPVDLETIRVIGISSGLMSVLVFAFYINSPVVSQLYRSPQILWLMCPLLIYWIARIWFLAARGEVHHDPVVFALLDYRSLLAGACGVAVILLAKIGPVGLHW